MPDNFKDVKDFSFLYATYSPDIKRIAAGDPQPLDYKSGLCTTSTSVGLDSYEVVDNKAIVVGGVGSSDYTKVQEMFKNESFTSPVGSEMVTTSPYGVRNGKMHNGKDYAPPVAGGALDKPGVHPVTSVADGVVTDAGYMNGYGNYIEVEHTTANGEKYKTFYAHLGTDANPGFVASVGKSVVIGQPLGFMGNSGDSRSSVVNGTGTHLHFEVRLPDGSRVDPSILGY